MELSSTGNRFWSSGSQKLSNFISLNFCPCGHLINFVFKSPAPFCHRKEKSHQNVGYKEIVYKVVMRTNVISFTSPSTFSRDKIYFPNSSQSENSEKVSSNFYSYLFGMNGSNFLSS